MNDASQPLHQHYLDLLSTAALGPLTDEEMTELESLQGKFPDIAPSEFEEIAAAALLSMTPQQIEPMPAQLRQRIEAEAANHVPSRRSSASSAPQSVESYEAQPVSRPLPFGRRELLAWCAVAASLLLAAVAWLKPGDRPLATARAALLRDAGDVIQVDWGPGKHPFQQDVVGDVVWSDARQEGFMRFRGMPANDPSKKQYQLWIIDPSRDDEPVDGGVFDIPSDEEVIVPIVAKLSVQRPTAFAITIEQPGGVVVSTQEALPLLAAVPEA